MKVAFVHDWLLSHGGGEKVLECLMALYPGAPLHVLVRHHEFQNDRISSHPLHCSFIEKLPGGRTHYQRYLPLMPYAIEQFDLGGYDLILSTSHAVAKGVLSSAEQLHISYVHTPMRYAWDMYHPYLRESHLTRGLKSTLARAVLHYMRLWDRQSADRPDVLVANSHYVARRIAKTYRRPARVIYPPVDVERFRADQSRGDFYFTVSRMVSYKRIDLLVQAATRLGKELVVVGDGPEMARVKALAGPTVRLLGEQPDAVVTDHLQRCKAFLFAAREDFGISPVEAMAAGAPVLCLGRGGTRETVMDGVTGLYYEEQDVDAVGDAIQRFERDPQRFEAPRIRAHAESFSEARFRREMQELIAESMEQFRSGRPFA